MITDLIVGVVLGFARFVVGLLPDFGVPGWLENGVTGPLATVAGYVGGFGAWVPFGAATQATVLLLGAVGVALLVKLVRIVASFMAAGGGSAG